jgi:hypothetical protein
VPPQADWMAILDLSNRSLVTAQLCAALLRSRDQLSVPEDVRVFLSEVRTRNRERNRRLILQFNDALRALNSAGIEPALLKGIALRATHREAEFDRILGDVDLLVRPSEVERAIDVLQEAGLTLTARYPGNDVHVVAEFGRPDDVGLIDLHQRPPGPPGFAEIDNLDSHCVAIASDGLRASCPHPAVQIFFLMLHDQFHDGDYWRGGLDLRHLMDIAQLSQRHAVDWDLLERLCRTRLVRHALGTQLIAARRFAGAEIPERFMARSWTRVQHWRHMLQFSYPMMTLPLAVIGVISEFPNLVVHRAENRAGRRRVLGANAGRKLTASDHVRRVRRILSSPPGKL